MAQNPEGMEETRAEWQHRPESGAQLPRPLPGEGGFWRRRHAAWTLTSKWAFWVFCSLVCFALFEGTLDSKMNLCSFQNFSRRRRKNQKKLSPITPNPRHSEGFHFATLLDAAGTHEGKGLRGSQPSVLRGQRVRTRGRGHSGSASGGWGPHTLFQGPVPQSRAEGGLSWRVRDPQPGYRSTALTPLVPPRRCCLP